MSRYLDTFTTGAIYVINIFFPYLYIMYRMLYLSQLINSIKLVNIIMQGDFNLRKVNINQTKRFGATISISFT